MDMNDLSTIIPWITIILSNVEEKKKVEERSRGRMEYLHFVPLASNHSRKECQERFFSFFFFFFNCVNIMHLIKNIRHE